MRAKSEHQAKARALRQDGLTICEIARELRVAKSSVSVWVRDVVPHGTVPRPRHAAALVSCPRLVVWTSTHTRRCARCARLLPLELFGLTKRGRQSWCRACFRAYARERGAAHREQVASSDRRRRERARRTVLRYLGERSCCDCAERDIVVLEFDHLHGKTTELSRMVHKGQSDERILAELAKCDVVCSNCHRRRTAARAGWLRASPTWRLELGSRATTRARNQLHIYEHLAAHGCVDCGLRDLVVLDFDHVGAKHANVTRLATGGASLATLDAEIAHCEVRCASCHRRRTAFRGGHYRTLEDLGVGHAGPPAAIELAPDRRGRARSLRADGLTIAEIAAEVGAAASTVAVWVRDVPWDDDRRAAMHARRRELRIAADVADASNQLRTCRTCGITQPLAQFSRNGTGRRRQCKTCDAARNLSRTPEDRARAAVAQRERRHRRREVFSPADPTLAAVLRPHGNEGEADPPNETANPG